MCRIRAGNRGPKKDGMRRLAGWLKDGYQSNRLLRKLESHLRSLNCSQREAKGMFL